MAAILLPKILVIEDHDAARESLIAMLQEDRFDAVGVGTGNEGLDIIRKGGVDLLLLDIGLPDWNGFDLFHEIRKISDLPVMFMTARSDVVDKVTGLEIGADDYILKPVDYREVVARIRAILRRVQRGGPSGSPVKSGTPFTIDVEKRRIRVAGELLDLTPLEYGILKTLIEKPGHVFSREYLLHLDRSDASSVSDRSIDQHIKTLRKKLTGVFGQEVPVIVAHRNIGYALRDDWPED